MRDQEQPSRPGKPPAEDARRSQDTPRRVTSDDLLGAAGLLEIDHRGRVYSLRITQQGKLILTA